MWCTGWPTAPTPASSPPPRQPPAPWDGVIHAHARARWTGRTLRIEIEGWVDPGLTVSGADALGQQVARAVARQVPDTGSFTWIARAAPA